jgi:transcription elongation factor Elf1
MKLTILCPSCGSNKQLLEFNPGGESYQLYCDSCNCSYSIKLIGMSSRLDKLHDDLEFYLAITGNETHLSSILDKDLSPVFKCIVCGKNIVQTLN